MKHHHPVLLLLLLTVAAFCVRSQAQLVCGNLPYIFRNNNMTCPNNHVVCADVFNTIRDWYNGTTCHERRVLHNCMCPGGTICPVESNAHKLYASRSHTRYICQPKCTIPFCQNIQEAPSRPGERVDPIFPVMNVQNSPLFGRRTYNQIDCRCPRHHYPVQAEGVHRAVRSYTHRRNPQLGTYSTLYICRSAVGGPTGDPCIINS